MGGNKSKLLESSSRDKGRTDSSGVQRKDKSLTITAQSVWSTDRY